MNCMKRNTRYMPYLTCFLLTCGSVDNAIAQGVYESVDAEGNVTFSDTPPSGSTAVKEIELPSGPTSAEVRESMQQEQSLENRAAGMGGGDAAASQPAVPATVTQPESGTAVEQEGGVYVEEGYPVRRYPEESVREGATVREGYPAGRHPEENVREGAGPGMGDRRAPAGVSRPAARVR